MNGGIFDIWTVSLIALIVFLVLFFVLYNIEPISTKLTEGFMERMTRK